MQAFPYHTVSASGRPERQVTLKAENLPALMTAMLLLPAGTDTERAGKLLQKAESSRLLTYLPAAETHLEASVTVLP